MCRQMPCLTNFHFVGTNVERKCTVQQNRERYAAYSLLKSRGPRPLITRYSIKSQMDMLAGGERDFGQHRNPRHRYVNK